MKRKMKWVLIMMLATVMLGAGAAWAGQFTSPEAKAKVAAIEKQLAANKDAINQRYDQQAKQLELEQRAQIQAAVAKPAVSEGTWLSRGIETGCKVIFGLPGTMIYAGVTGLTTPTDSPLEYLVVPSFCRAFNTAKNQSLEYVATCGLEFATVWKERSYADPSKLNFLGDRTIKRYPLAQVGEAAAFWVPVSLTAFAALDGIQDVSQSGAIAIEGASGGTVGIGAGELINCVEKPLTKKFFGK